MKVVDGLINAKKPRPPNPKASPAGFQWPKQGDADNKTAEKLAASLQELLPAKGWKHTDLAKHLWGTMGEADQPRNTAAARRWIVAEHPIPNEETAGFVAEVLDVSMARLLDPKGKFDPHPAMIRPRSPNGVHAIKTKSGVVKKVKVKPKEKATVKAKGKGNLTPSGRDREKQRQYNANYRAKQAAEKTGKRKYTRRALPPIVNGAAVVPAHDPNVWVLAPDVPVPDYEFSSSEDHPGHLKIVVNAVVPHHRAMAILHMLEHTVPVEVEGED